ncbi:haloacid dehalogenase-like hydrolase, partial [Streptomyces sp. S12]|nr:haloacid dehalogenase-like hydrolase [Streptomyces sp. S12]
MSLGPAVAARFPAVREGAPLVVFDFDHTLYDGDSGSHLFAWLIQRSWWRMALALLITPLAGPMVAWLRTRRVGI